MTHLPRAASLAHPLAVGPKICQLVVGSSRALFGKKVAHPNFSGLDVLHLLPALSLGATTAAAGRRSLGGIPAMLADPPPTISIIPIYFFCPHLCSFDSAVPVLGEALA